MEKFGEITYAAPMRVIGAFLAVLFTLFAHADGPLEMTPPLDSSFPFKDGSGEVTLTCPILINTVTIVPAEAVLRVVYIRPQSADPETVEARQKSNMEEAYTRPAEESSKKIKRSPEEEAAMKIAQKTIWPTSHMFKLAMAQLSGVDIRLVYFDPEKKDLIDEPVAFPEGLLLSQQAQGVTVLSVETKSSGARAGIKAGDIITRIGDTPLNGKLSAFVFAYHEAKKAADDGGPRQLPFWIKTGDAPERLCPIKLPLSLKGSLLDSPP